MQIANDTSANGFKQSFESEFFHIQQNWVHVSAQCLLLAQTEAGNNDKQHQDAKSMDLS